MFTGISENPVSSATLDAPFRANAGLSPARIEYRTLAATHLWHASRTCEDALTLAFGVITMGRRRFVELTPTWPTSGEVSIEAPGKQCDRTESVGAHPSSAGTVCRFNRKFHAGFAL